MANSIAESMLQVFRSPDAILDVRVLDRLRSYVASGGQPRAAVDALSSSYVGSGDEVRLLYAWAAECKLAGLDGLIEDTLKRLVRSKYDTKLTRSLFERMQRSPKWLEDMIVQPRWRELFYSLSSSFEDCLLLDFAVQRISAEGHEDEIRSLRTTANNFGVFLRVLLPQLERLVAGSASSAMREIVALCTQSEATYLFSYCALIALEHATGEDAFGRLAQEMESSIVPARRRQFVQVGFLVAGLREHPALASVLMTLHKTTPPSGFPGDLMQLHRIYLEPAPGTVPPPVRFLRDWEVVTLLLRSLFVPEQRVAEKYQRRYAQLLAYAVCAVDTRAAEASEAVSQVDTSEVAATADALWRIVQITSPAPFGTGLRTARGQLEGLLVQQPILGMAVALWSASVLTSDQHFSSNFDDTAHYLALLNCTAHAHPCLAAELLRLYIACLAYEPSLNALTTHQHRIALLGCFAQLVVVGHGLAVLDTFEGWAVAGSLDRTLLRAFATSLIARIVEPPLAPEFAGRLLHVVCLSLDATSVDRADKPALCAFLDACCQSSMVQAYEPAHKALVPQASALRLALGG